MTLYVLLTFTALLAGMAISVRAFGTGCKRKRMFREIYFSIEDVDGIGILYTKTGEYSAILRIENPVQKFSADIDSRRRHRHSLHQDRGILRHPAHRKSGAEVLR